MGSTSIFIEGRNCWKRTRADRVAFLIDGEAYFKAFKEAALKAQRTIFILSWDIDTRILLRRDKDPSGLPNPLGDFLRALLARRPSLHIYVLNWDFSIFYRFERQVQPIFDLGLGGQGRLHFKFDGMHPIGASHHQKIVVIDDAVAFAGGLDLSRSRWDTPIHNAHDPKRVDPDGTIYKPFHDVQVIIDGEAAVHLGEIARERWYLATGQHLRRVTVPDNSWPSYLEPHIEEASVAISRTLPAFMGRSEVREIESLYLDMIGAANHSIYIETQYFTSACIGEALAARLKEKKGPEILVILPRKNSGWLEENSMGVLRTGLLSRLRQADPYGHLGIYFPVVSGLEEIGVNLHSKVMVIDDRIARVGSSNLSNRSMGLDTECDITIDSEGDDHQSDGIAGFRNILLAEHLAVLPEKIAEAISSKNSLLGAVEALRGANHTLRPFVTDVPQWASSLLPEAAIFDPERPLDKERLIEEFIPSDGDESASRPFLRGALLLVLLMVLAGLWKWSPLRDWIDLQTLLTWSGSFRENPMALPIVILIYVVGGIVMFPVLLLIFMTVFTFEPLAGILYSLAGCLSSAIAGYGAGNVIGFDLVRRLARGHLNQLSRRLARHGLDAIIFFRLVPILPFTVVNLIAGASRLRLRDYILGTVIGMVPGILFITLFQTSLARAISNPQLLHFFILITITAIIIAATHILKKWLNRASYVKFLYTRISKKNK
jgi:phospholipase D1/2